jgi:hypothetical protein
MSLKEFEKNDIFRNTIKANPKFKFKISSGVVYINDSYKQFVTVNEINVNPTS